MHTRIVLASMGIAEASETSDSITILCPFHGENSPSLAFDLVRGLFYCHGCGVGGSTVDFIRMIQGCSGLEALRLFVRLSRQEEVLAFSPMTELERDQQRKAHLAAAYAVYAQSMVVDWRRTKEHYMLERGYTPRTLAHFGVRLHQLSPYSILIPILEQGKFRGYVARRTDDGKPKYLYNRGFSRGTTVDGMLVPGPVAVVEGKLDQMLAWQYGFPSVACIFGWKITATQMKKLAEYATALYAWTDNDEAGERGYAALVEAARPYGLEVIRPVFPPLKDIGEMSRANHLQAIGPGC